jgi:hypothetical protein
MEELRICVPLETQERINLEETMKNIIVVLKYLETPHCRKNMPKEILVMRRKEITMKFRSLILRLAAIS